MRARNAHLPAPVRRRVVGWLTMLLTVLVVLAGCAATGSEQPDSTGGNDAAQEAGAGYQSGDGSWTTWEPSERDEPVDIEGTTFDDDDVDLAQLRGDVVVLNFWYAACPPCRAEAPDLAALHEEYDDGVTMLGINPRDGAATAQAFERNFEVPYPSLHDEGAQAVAALEGLVPLQAMPTTLVLDAEGRVAGRVLGQIDREVVSGMISDVLAEET